MSKVVIILNEFISKQSILDLDRDIFHEYFKQYL